jgi:hypothetical protein
MITALPPPSLRSGQRGFVGHAARQAQHVAHGFVVTGVGPHPATAQRRAERGVVDGDNRVQARCLVVAEDHLFVVIEIGMGEHGHCGFLFVVLCEAVIPGSKRFCAGIRSAFVGWASDACHRRMVG